MSIAIAEEHRALTDAVVDFLGDNQARAANRALLEESTETLPTYWKGVADLGWLGLHLPEDVGGSGFGLLELAIVVEQFGKQVAPGPLLPTVIASAAINAAASDEVKKRFLPGLIDGTAVAGVALAADVTATGGTLSGEAATVLGAPVATLLVLPVGDDLAVVDAGAPGVEITVPTNIDPSRRSGRVQLSGAAAEIIPDGRRVFIDLARALSAAEAAGLARACTEQAAAYAKVRTQFGRQIAMFQAVKHHCANMAVETETATAIAWDAARAGATGGDQLSYAAALAASLAIPGAVSNSQLNIQVHGGIGYTWEHDAHLYLRRALALSALVDAAEAAEDVTALTASGVKRSRALELPPEAETFREQARAFANRVKDMDDDARKAAMLEEGYALPHWPKPYGRDASPVEQIVIEQEFEAAGVTKPSPDPITAYITLTLIQNGSEDQIARFVPPALRLDMTWCQLFSEPDAGSDAAGIKTRATRVEGGWQVNGQKVWTSGAHRAAVGLATVRTNPDVPKHKGITMMIIDMHAEGVTIRPLRQLTGGAEFNEVFLEDVFVPDADVVGEVDGGWRVARATLGNESVSIGRGVGAMSLPKDKLIAALEAKPHRLPGGAARLGRYFATMDANQLMNLRNVQRAVGGSGPGPEAAVNKLVFSEAQQEGAAIAAALADNELAYLDGPSGWAASNILGVKVWTIGGGTSEIKRNQIGELILGLPRDPLLA
jgi:alkylation response protein AidB-like acyl-CoA dehydrogenase